MPLPDYVYCKIFVAKASEKEVRAVISSALGVRFRGKSTDMDDVIIEVRRNPDSHGDMGFNEDFLHWPIIVEFEDHSRISPLKEKVTLLLNSLWGESIPSIAACDFEDQLPWGGGIKRDLSSMRGFHRTD